MIKTIAEANAALLPYVPLVSKLTGKDTTLERILPLMALLGNPQERLRTIHIAGTSGKTSTSYFMAALLGAAGRTVGLTVSPHVDSVTERVQINGQPLPVAEFCSELDIFLNLIKQAATPPSYFELMYAFALWVFERRGADYAVIETGLGGLHDATNVVTRGDKICIITDIGFDHMAILGNTLPEIAAQKAGIIHPGNTVFSYKQADEVMRVIKGKADDVGATLHEIVEADELAPSTLDFAGVAKYQHRNWLLAHRVYEYLMERDALPRLANAQLAQTLHVQVPGRMDIRTLHGKTIVMDGAHNDQKMAAFIDSFQALYPDVRPALLISLKDDKEFEQVVRRLAPLTSQVIVTSFKTSQDMVARSMDPAVLAESFVRNGATHVKVIANQRDAYQALLATSADIAIVTGSFYLLSQIRKISA